VMAAVVLQTREVEVCRRRGRGGGLCVPDHPSVALSHSVSSLRYVLILQVVSMVMMEMLQTYRCCRCGVVLQQ
jgi:hypothetical protein